MKKARFLSMGLPAVFLALGLVLTACGSVGGGGVPQKAPAADTKEQDGIQLELRVLEPERNMIRQQIEDGVPAEQIEEWLQTLLFNKSLTQAEFQHLVSELKVQVQESAEWQAEKQAKEEAARKAEEERWALAERQEQERRAAIDAANAKGVSAEDFEYDINRDGTGILIKEYKGLATIVNIPATIEGFPVKELGEWAFYRSNITSVTIPDSVTVLHEGGSSYDERDSQIFYGIFSGCGNLQSVTMSKSIKTIPVYAFKGCYNLTSVIIPNGVTVIGRGAFSGCVSLQNLTLPDSLIEIHKGAFSGAGLTDIVLPKNLKRLGDNYDRGVFQNCEKLGSVTFQSNGLDIGSEAFSGCTALKSLTINGNFINIGDFAFSGCSFTTVNVGPNVTRIANVDEILERGVNLPLAAKAALNKARN
jgi:hypothetical protein